MQRNATHADQTFSGAPPSSFLLPHLATCLHVLLLHNSSPVTHPFHDSRVSDFPLVVILSTNKMVPEGKPVVTSAPPESTATVSDLMSHMRTTFFATDFQKIEKILIDREEEMKTRLSELSTELYSWKIRYLSKESEHGTLLLKHLTAEEELNKYKAECQAMREAKAQALAERDNWAKKFNSLNARISKLEDLAEEVFVKNPLCRRAVEEVIGVFGKKIKVESGSPKFVERKPKCGVSNPDGDERMLMSPGAGSTTCGSHRKEHAVAQEEDTYSFDITCGNGGANRKQLVSGAESFYKFMDKSLAGGKQPQSTEIIEINSDGEMDATSIRNVSASGLKSGEKRMTPELVVEGSGQTGMGKAVNAIENPILAPSSKRKQASVILSENDSSDDDPFGRRKVKRLKKLGNLSRASPVNSCVAAPSMVCGNTGVSSTSYKPGLGHSNINVVSPKSCNPSLNCRTDAIFSPASSNPGFITPCTGKLKAKLRSRIPSYSSDSSDSADENDTDQCIDDIIASIRRQKEKSGWVSQGDMLQAFETNNELCLNAVCALHRQRNSKDNSRGFEVVDALRGSALAKFLIDGDQHGKLRKSVSELEQYDPKGLEYCRKLAIRYSIQLFDMYQKKEDPFFCPP